MFDIQRKTGFNTYFGNNAANQIKRNIFLVLFLAAKLFDKMKSNDCSSLKKFILSFCCDKTSYVKLFSALRYLCHQVNN